MRRALLLLLAVLGVAAGGCGEDGGGDDATGAGPQTDTASEAATSTQAAAQQAKKPGPEVCLLRGQASNVERRAATFWRGSLPNGGLLRVEKFGSASEAREVVRAATDIDAESAGRYAVLGTLKGRGSKDAVQTVADCLRNG